MSIITTININNPSNYIFDSDKISIDGINNGRLKLQTQNQDYAQSFASDAGFVYDNTRSEFIGGLVRQKDQRPANSVIASTFSTTLNANWGNNNVVSLNATLNGTPTLSGGRLDCRGGIIQGHEVE